MTISVCVCVRCGHALVSGMLVMVLIKTKVRPERGWAWIHRPKSKKDLSSNFGEKTLFIEIKNNADWNDGWVVELIDRYILI